MAVMHPHNIENYEKATEGEKKVFRFLEEVAIPYIYFICLYEVYASYRKLRERA